MLGFDFSEIDKNKLINRITFIALSLILMSILYQVTLLYYQSVTYFNRTPWDGTFQTLFPLRKMDIGELPGRDFFYFHGNGIPYLLYPIYTTLKWIGMGEIVSGLHSTFIINTLSLILPIYLFLRGFYGRNISLVSIIIILVLFDFIPFVGAYFSPLFLGAPMGIRFIPHMIVAILVGRFLIQYESSNIISIKKQFILIVKLAFCASLGVYFGAEQGFYAVGGGAVALFFYFLMERRFIYSLAIPVSFVLFFIISLVVTSLVFFQSLDSLKAISVISNDQVWVFGVFPNSFFMSFSELFYLDNMSAIPSQMATLFAFVFFVVLYILNKKEVIGKILFISLTVLFFSGILSWVSNVGYIGAHQTALLIRFVLIGLVSVGVALLIKLKLL